MTTLAKPAETLSPRAIPSILIGYAMMFVILELGVTFLAARLDQTRAALIVTAIIGLIMLAFFSIFSLVTGAQITLKADRLWILVGATALNGVGEETLFRGYVFGGLRREAGLSIRTRQ